MKKKKKLGKKLEKNNILPDKNEEMKKSFNRDMSVTHQKSAEECESHKQPHKATARSRGCIKPSRRESWA